jgi:hypothetical protein
MKITDVYYKNHMKYSVWESSNLRQYLGNDPIDGDSTLPWWWGLSAPENLTAMPAVA